MDTLRRLFRIRRARIGPGLETPASNGFALDYRRSQCIRKGHMGIGVAYPLRVVDQLGFKQMEKRLGHTVIPAISLATHALHKLTFLQFLSKAGAGILPGPLDPTE